MSNSTINLTLTSNNAQDVETKLKKYVATIIGDGTSYSFTIPLPTSLYNREIVTQLYDVGGNVVETDVYTSTTSVTISFNRPLATNTTYTLVIIG